MKEQVPPLFCPFPVALQQEYLNLRTLKMKTVTSLLWLLFTGKLLEAISLAKLPSPARASPLLIRLNIYLVLKPLALVTMTYGEEPFRDEVTL